MKVGPLYHWAPSARFDSIRDRGLLVFSAPTVSTGDHAYPYVCLSPSPSRAWGLSGDMEWVSEHERWDLWQVELPDKAEVHIRPFWGRDVDEIKVYTPIPPDHLWYVGSRDVPRAVQL